VATRVCRGRGSGRSISDGPQRIGFAAQPCEAIAMVTWDLAGAAASKAGASDIARGPRRSGRRLYLGRQSCAFKVRARLPALGLQRREDVVGLAATSRQRRYRYVRLVRSARGGENGRHQCCPEEACQLQGGELRQKALRRRNLHASSRRERANESRKVRTTRRRARAARARETPHRRARRSQGQRSPHYL